MDFQIFSQKQHEIQRSGIGNTIFQLSVIFRIEYLRVHMTDVPYNVRQFFAKILRRLASNSMSKSAENSESLLIIISPDSFLEKY